jgi:hypothetical protein
MNPLETKNYQESNNKKIETATIKHTENTKDIVNLTVSNSLAKLF